MIVDLCMCTGWGYREVMDMPFQTFAYFVGKARKAEARKANLILMELCDIVGIAYAGPEYKQAVSQHYRERLMDDQQLAKAKNPYLFNADDSKSSAEAAQILAQTFKTKLNLMGLSSV